VTSRERAGLSGMTFVLIPGAGGARWYWHLLVPELRARGRKAIACELPTADPAKSFPDYADAVAEQSAGAVDVTLVAQSMGGFTVPLVAARLDVRRIVLVNAMVPAPGETAGHWWESTGQPQARAAKAAEDGRDISGAFDDREELFHDVPEQLVAEAFATEVGQADRPFGDTTGAWPDLPTVGVCGADDRLFPAAFQQRVARERLGIELDVMSGGHLLALSRPAALAEYLVAAPSP
jgi:pimeloyl-ACP methyl ester carboxylesterase